MAKGLRYNSQEEFDAWRAARPWVREKSASRQAADAEKVAKVSAPKLIRQSSKGPNKTEAAFQADVLYWRKLRGEIADYYEHDSITLRLANGVRYTPDFPVIALDGSLRFYEVKGTKRKGWNPVQDDASVKVKTAASLYLRHKFYLVWKQDGVWQEQEVLP